MPGRSCLIAGLATVLLTTAASAEDAPPSIIERAPTLGDTKDALPGFIRLAAPVPSSSRVSVAGSLGWGLYPAVGEQEGPSQQYTGQLAVGVTPWDFFSARLGFRGDVNQHAPDPDEKSANLYGEPEVAARFQWPVTGRLFMGAEAEVRLIGAQAPDVNWAATTPTFRGLLSYQLMRRTWLGAQLGYRWDNSAEALAPIERLRDGDRRTLHASSFDAIELGLGASHRVGPAELLFELSADVLVGADAPRFAEDPISLGVAGRYELGRTWTLRAEFEVSPSTAPDPYPQEELIATRPRVALGFGVVAHFLDRHPAPAQAKRPRPVAPPPAAEAPSPPPAPPPTGKVSGRVVDEGGRPLSDVQVSLEQDDEPPVVVFTDAEGHFVLDSIAPGPSRLSTKSPGYDPVTKELVVLEDGESTLDFTVYASVPAGQVRGRVLDLAGHPLNATVTIEPGDVVVPVDASGAFSLDLAPGKYTVRFSLEGYGTQVRVIRVQDKGVVVLSIALEK